jgi:2-dehydro-3-deoxyglucarate aldolase
MDAGAHGLVVPMVNTAEEAKQAVEAMQYPPRGARGVGLARAQDYGPGFEAYKSWLESEAALIVQVEHIKAVENLESILSVEGVDAFIVGPYDLSGSLGVPGEFDHPRMLEAMDEIMRVARKARPSAGFHVVPPRPEMVSEKLDQGYTFIAYSVDFIFLGQAARDGLTAIRSVLEGAAE